VEKIRDDKATFEAQLEEKTRQLIDLQANFDAYRADVNTR